MVSLIAATMLLASTVGPLLGFALLLLVPSLPFEAVNVVSGVTYVVLTPLVALTTAYVYFDAAVHDAREREESPDVLPAELPRTPSS